jgi:hypothetical protein
MEKEYQQFIRAALESPESATIQMTLLFEGGSDRSFYGVRTGDQRSFVFMHYNSAREENNYYAAIAEFLLSIDVAAPRIIRHDPVRCFILMQDLGKVDLWSSRQAPWEQRQTLYRKTLDIILKLHRFSSEAFPVKTVPLMEAFSVGLYRWERDYFRENFVERVCKVKHSSQSFEALEEELAALAERLERRSRRLIHRDLQSRNVMVFEGKPVLIDFQGMRFGNPFYDLGSLLYDPYVAFTNEERLDLLSHYYRSSDYTLDWAEFQTVFREASAQRLMQALGAYGFLGWGRGLRNFLEYIPQGLENLIDAATHAGNLPNLLDLARTCRERVQSSEFIV